VAFAITTPPPKSSNLIFEPMFKEPLALLLPVSHKLSTQESITLRELAELPFLLSETGCAYREEIERVFHLKGIQLRPQAEIGSGQAIKRCVQLGMGVAMLPALSVAHPPKDTVVRTLDDEELSLVIGITYSPERNWYLIEREFYSLIKRDLSTQIF
jgi:DNA-binding transcriptional LysR family regulator